MQLLEQLIRKKLELSEEYFINREYKKSIWNFYSAYNIALAIANGKDDNNKYRNKIWVGFLKNRFDEKKFKKLKNWMKNDMGMIIQALKIINIESEKLGFNRGEFYKPGMIGILSYEYDSGS